MSYQLHREEGAHQKVTLTVQWPGSAVTAVVERTGDGCITINIPKQFLYPQESEMVLRALGTLIGERRAYERRCQKRAVALRATQIETITDWESDGEIAAALAAGRGVVYFEFDYRTVKVRAAERFPQADVWYTERNGDPITLLVPKGTAAERLPNEALGYIILEWIDPDNAFGTGVHPRQPWKDQSS